MNQTETNNKLEKTIEVLQEELRSLRAGRANAELVENVSVDAYGSDMPLKEVASITTPQANQIIIQPWDPSLIQNIEKALQKPDSELNPVTEGNSIRVSIPPLTEERRKELVKKVGGQVEEARIAVRNIRDEVMDAIDKSEKQKEISEDEKFKKKEEIQKMVDKYNNKIKEIADHKEKEIMEG